MLSLIAFAALAAGLAALIAAVISCPLLLLFALPVLSIGLPLFYFQWNTGGCIWKVSLPLGILWGGLGLFFLLAA